MHEENLSRSQDRTHWLVAVMSTLALFAVFALSPPAAATDPTDMVAVYEEEVDSSNCWESMPLLTEYETDSSGQETETCVVYIDTVGSYVDHYLPEIDDTYDDREGYIDRLVEQMVDYCAEEWSPDYTYCSDESAEVYVDYHLYDNGQPGNEEQPDDWQMLTWAWDQIDNMHNLDRLEDGGSDQQWPPDGPYYVHRPAIQQEQPRPSNKDDIRTVNQPDEEESDPLPDPRTPPPTVPDDIEWDDGGDTVTQETTSNDQYGLADNGWYRRIKQSDGTWQCYFNGNDGSYAVLGECS